jgi:electron transport complex protein RnfB
MKANAGLPTADAIDALLPQTQCTKCGYAGCRPYAEAVAAGAAHLNQCPPGGAAGIERLAHLLGRPVTPLNPAHGAEGPRSVALIDESNCIGCTLCIQVCPTDAILGAPKQMHTVLLAECTGCELCVKPCPVDCIAIVPLREVVARGAAALAEEAAMPVAAHARRWRARYEARKARLERQRVEQDERLAQKAQAKLKLLDEMPADTERDRKRAAVQAAIERARARREASG